MGLRDTLVQAYVGLPTWAQPFVKYAIVILLGWLAIRLTVGLLLWLISRNKHLDQTVRSFISILLRAFGYIILTIFVVSLMGVDVTALLGGLSIGGFVLGFALKDTLGNLAAGFMLLIYRPFNIGDFVEVDGYTGTVEELGVALTRVRRFDGLIVTLPNGSVLGGPIVNFSRAVNRRAAATVGISYDDDIDSAIRAILDEIQREPRILADPAPEVVIKALSESSVDLEVRAWTKNSDFGPVNARLPGMAKRAVEAAGCSIPFPQRDIRVQQVSTS